MVVGIGCDESISTANDGGIHASAHGVHTPAIVQVVGDVHVSEANPRHALVAVWPEPVVHNSDPHLLVGNVAIAMAQQHDLVVVVEPVVGDGYAARRLRDVDQPVLALVEGVVVDPNPPAL